MSNSYLAILWGAAYAACAVLGFLPEPEGALKAACIGASLIFFLPPAVMLYRADRAGDTKTLKRLRNLSILWLVTAMVLICLNILSFAASELTGYVLYYALVILAAPLVCGQYWLLSLFLWACLLVCSIKALRKK